MPASAISLSSFLSVGQVVAVLVLEKVVQAAKDAVWL